MAAVNSFLKIDGIKGESQDKTHKDEIEILSFSWGVSNAGTGGFGTGSGSGKAAVLDATFLKHVDKSSVPLAKYCFTGKSVGDADFVMRKAGGDKPVEYLKYKLTEVFVTSVQHSGSDGGGIATESVSLNFSKIKMTYTPQKADGTADADIDGTADIKANDWT